MLEKKSWLRLRVEDAFREGLARVYTGLSVDPSRYLLKLQKAHERVGCIKCDVNQESTY